MGFRADGFDTREIPFGKLRAGSRFARRTATLGMTPLQ